MTNAFTPDFLTVEDVLQLHARQLAKYGGAQGIRDAGLLESAVAAPMATYGGQFLHEDVYEMAAALIFSLASNHPFVDGNKRVAAAAGLVFLELNGVSALGFEEAALEAAIMSVAEGGIDKHALACFLRENGR